MTTQSKKSAKTKEFTSTMGNKFVLQKVGAAQWLDIMDESEVNGSPKRSILYPKLLENVVVQPQLKTSDFDGEEYDGTAELEEVAKAALRFQQGKQ